MNHHVVHQHATRRHHQHSDGASFRRRRQPATRSRRPRQFWVAPAFQRAFHGLQPIQHVPSSLRLPSRTRLDCLLSCSSRTNLFPSLNVHTGVEEARRRENVSECRKLVVGLGTDGPRVDSGLFELAGTVDGSLDLIRRHRQFLPPFRLLPNRLIRLPPLPPLHLPRLCPSKE